MLDQVFAATQESATWQGAHGWRQYYDAQPVEAALPLVKKPPAGDPVTVRVSGVWANRVNSNLWRDFAEAFAAPPMGLVPGFIDMTHPENVPAFGFVGNMWEQDEAAETARTLLLRAFAEWSSLRAGASPVTGRPLATGLGFRLAGDPSEAIIELEWRPLPGDLAARTNRSVRQDGTVTWLRSGYNSSNRWWFGPAAATPPDRMHFYSSALHEIGHLVGLWDSNDPNCVMIANRVCGPHGPAFDALDDASKRIAYALYSHPLEQTL